MPRHKPGTLVTICPREWKENGDDIRDIVEKDGYGFLYIIEKFLPEHHSMNEHPGNHAYECRSLATGKMIQLFPHEITTRPVKEGAYDE